MTKYILTKTGSVESFVTLCDKFSEASEQMGNHIIKDKYHLDGFTFARRRKWGYTVKNGVRYSKVHIYKINMI